MADLERALALVAEADDAYFVGPVEETVVARAERLLGLRFPSTYRRFLCELGAGDVHAQEFYGITGGDLEAAVVPNAVGLALADRNEGLPPHLFPFYDYGDGTTVALDLSVPEGEEGHVVSWHAHPDSGVEPEARDFGEFFLRTIEESA